MKQTIVLLMLVAAPRGRDAYQLPNQSIQNIHFGPDSVTREIFRETGRRELRMKQTGHNETLFAAQVVNKATLLSHASAGGLSKSERARNIHDSLSSPDRELQSSKERAVLYSATFLAISSSCSGWVPVVEVGCGSNPVNIVGEAQSKTKFQATCVEHPTKGPSFAACVFLDLPKDQVFDDFVVSLTIQFVCAGDSDKDVVGEASILDESELECSDTENPQASFASVAHLDASMEPPSFVEDFSCERGGLVTWDSGGSGCLNSSVCPLGDCALGGSSSRQNTPIPASAFLSGVTSSPAGLGCQPFLDTCDYQFDGICDAGDLCPSGTDCFDCDPCQQYRYDGCEACTAAGCSWCGEEALCVSNVPELLPSFLMCKASSDFVETCEPSSQPDQAYNDPLFEPQMWLYDLINVQDAWDMGYTGKTIGIRVNDDGVDHTHPEFQGKFDVSNSCSVFTPAGDNGENEHGTAVASLALGAADNGKCAAGIAHGSTLSACRIINSEDPGDIAPEVLDDSVFYDNMSGMHISQNSYGVQACKARDRRRELQSGCPFNSRTVCEACNGVDWGNASPDESCETVVAEYCGNSLNFEESAEACTDFLDLFTECEYDSLDASQIAAFKKGTTEGRDGKGIVYVFTSGNARSAGSDVNFRGTSSNRYTISVGAVGRDGLHASYSNGGAALFVTAPGGDGDHFTNGLAAKPGGGCRDVGQGTSFAAPIVSGVVALMLEANEDLSWRDVQGALAASSRKVAADSGSWTTNGAGFHHSDIYGFGLVDAGAAVRTALAWENYPAEVQIVSQSGKVDLRVPEFQGGAVNSAVGVDDENFVVESVAIYLDLLHSSRGDLEITLESPSGTVSVLHPGRRPESSQVERWKLFSVRHWGETAVGQWKLRLVDKKEGDVAVCVDKIWKLGTLGGDSIDCKDLKDILACEDGAEGSNFVDVFGDIRLDDLSLQSEEGLTPGDSCCACGGGHSPNDFENVLRSWRLVLHGHSTKQPTPTAAPTLSPTTTAPVAATSGPTKIPSSEPTKVPTTRPTDLPVAAPTMPPVLTTTTPTASPAQSPTKSPTEPPKVAATLAPTIPPTEFPTTTPSVALTPAPIQVPTNGPIPIVTVATTQSPTNVLTKAPTAVPTALPTAPPSAVSPVSMTVLPMPKKTPTSTPVLRTRQPVTVATGSPTPTPTATPTVQPTVQPSGLPTSSSTATPTSSPTSSPLTPTALPVASTSIPTQSPVREQRTGTRAPVTVSSAEMTTFPPTSMDGTVGRSRSDALDVRAYRSFIVTSLSALLLWVQTV